MTTQTEKLRAEFFKALENNAYETDQIEAILKACKEAGLKFVEVISVIDPKTYSEDGSYPIEKTEIEEIEI